jgi:hypothetical protein
LHHSQEIFHIISVKQKAVGDQSINRCAAIFGM